MVPPTPFVFNRLPGGNGVEDESLLLEQEPIFGDRSIAETSVWGSPKLGGSSRPGLPVCAIRSPRERTPERHPIVVEQSASLAVETESDASFFDESTFVGRGERSVVDEGLDDTRADGHRGLKRASSSFTSLASSKTARLTTPNRDDYYQRRLSRQSSSSAMPSPSLPSLHLSLASSTASSSRSLLSASSSRRLPVPTKEVNVARDVYGDQHPTDEVDGVEMEIPPGRPSALSRFLAKSSALHPPAVEHINQSISNLQTCAVGPSTPRRSSINHQAAYIALNNTSAPRSSISPGSAENRPPRPTSPMAIHAEATHPLRRSTSQRVLGFFADLLGTSTPAKSVRNDERPEREGLNADCSRAEGGLRDESLEDGDGGTNQSGIALAEEHQQSQELSISRDQLDQPDVTCDRSHRSDRPPARFPPGFVPLTRPNRAFVSNTASRASNPIRHTDRSKSSFTSAALARLPRPGQGASSAGERVTVKPAERAADIRARRALFERPQNQPPLRGARMTKTIPLVGKTPGRASAARAAQRKRVAEAAPDPAV